MLSFRSKIPKKQKKFLQFGKKKNSLRSALGKTLQINCWAPVKLEKILTTKTLN